MDVRQKRMHSADQGAVALQPPVDAQWNISKVTGYFRQLFAAAS